MRLPPTHMHRARVAGLVYLFVFVTGITSLMLRGAAAQTAALVSGILYIAVTLLFYDLFKPVNKAVSLIAAAISLAGIAAGPIFTINPLPLFGCYCLLIAYLIVGSTFLPRFLAALMAFAGLGWLMFLSPALARSPSPYMFAPGVVGEGALTLWLLFFGIDVPGWELMRAAAKGAPA